MERLRLDEQKTGGETAREDPENSRRDGFKGGREGLENLR